MRAHTAASTHDQTPTEPQLAPMPRASTRRPRCGDAAAFPHHRQLPFRRTERSSWGGAEAGVGLVGGDVPPPLAYAGGVGLVMPVAGVRRGVIPASGMKLTIEVAAMRSRATAETSRFLCRRCDRPRPSDHRERFRQRALGSSVPLTSRRPMRQYTRKA
jgi:hypothetical protein